MAADFGASILCSIRGCLLILLVVGLLVSSNERFVYTAGPEDKHFKMVSIGSLLGDADGSSSSGHGVDDENSLRLGLSEILRQDEARVKWLQLKMNLAQTNSATSNPTTSGSTSGKGTIERVTMRRL